MTEPEFRLEAFLPYRLSVLANRLSRRFAREYQAEFGISIHEWRAVAILGAHRRDGAGLSVWEIAERAAMDRVAVSRAISLLTAKKLAAKTPHGDDGRLVDISLTAAGIELFDRISARGRALEAGLLRHLDDPASAEAAISGLERAVDKFLTAGAEGC